MLKKIKWLDVGFYSICAAIALWIMLPSGSKSPSDADLMSKSVRLTSVDDRGSCSGEQVKAASGENYILTAAHCLSLAAPDNTIQVISEDGRRMTRRVIAEDATSDLALIEGLPKTEGLYIGKVAYRNQPVRTFTHGKALATYKTEGVLIEEKKIEVLIGMLATPEDIAKCTSKPKYKAKQFWIFDVCILETYEMATTAFIVPGSSGGMVVNTDGELVGVVSAGGEGMGWLVSLDDIRRFLRNY